ncbi:MAG: extracellular solute-binding protein [Hyphomicrobiales bacterium]|nr:extracellular solute-binding protein [Hyphomicrobiales bacterium]
MKALAGTSRIASVALLMAGTALAGSTVVNAQEITIWSGFPEMVPFYEHVAEGMAESHPDLTVVVEAIPLREHEKRIALSLPAGQAADVIELGASTAQRYLEADLFQPAASSAADLVSNGTAFGEFFVDQASNGGTVYAVPLFRGQSALYYNTGMFAAAGLDAPPATMDDIMAFSEKLTQRDDNGNPVVSGWSLRFSGGGQGIAEKFWINLFQFGGSVIEQDDSGMWKANFANEAGRKALSQYLDSVFVDKTVTPEMPADAEAFEREQTAMFIRESWVIGDIASKAPDLSYATSTLPTGSIVVPVNLYVSTDGDAGNAAWDFAATATSPENQTWLLDNVGWLPNRADVDYSAVVEKTPAIGAFVDYPDDYGFFALPAIGPIEEVLTRLAERLVPAYNDASLAGDDAKIDTFLQEAAAEIDGILEREGLLSTQ